MRNTKPEQPGYQHGAAAATNGAGSRARDRVRNGSPLRFWTITAVLCLGVTLAAMVISAMTVFIVGIAVSVVIIGTTMAARQSRTPAGTPTLVSVLLFFAALSLAITGSVLADKLYLATFGDTGTGTQVVAHSHRRNADSDPTYTCTIHTPAGVTGVKCPPGDPTEGWQGFSFQVVYDPMGWVNTQYTAQLGLTGPISALAAELALTCGLIGAGLAYGLARRERVARDDRSVHSV